MLSYSLLRERIIFNDSLNSFETDPIYGHRIDQKYNDLSVLIERTLNDLKNNHDSILDPLISYMSDFDSPQFCDAVIGSS